MGDEEFNEMEHEAWETMRELAQVQISIWRLGNGAISVGYSFVEDTVCLTKAQENAVALCLLALRGEIRYVLDPATAGQFQFARRNQRN
jgi:hypothetical protein